MSSDPGSPTLDQLRVLITVAETGSFAGAARKLNRATSVVSYTIANLEAQLGLALFDRETTRRPQLTTAGRIVLSEARSLTGGVSILRAKVKGMLQGLEGELHVVLDTLLPGERVVDALTAFSAAFPTVALHLHLETLGAVANLVLCKTASIGVSGPFALDFEALSRVGVGSLRMVPVAAPCHPLASPPPGGHGPGAGREHVQLVVYDRSPLTTGRDFSVTGNRTWRLADLASKHMLLKAAIGWGMMPEWMVADDVKAGRLVHLDLPDRRAFDYLVDVVFRTDAPPGPAAAWLMERFVQQAGGQAPSDETERRQRDRRYMNRGEASRRRSKAPCPAVSSERARRLTLDHVGERATCVCLGTPGGAAPVRPR